MIETVEVPTRPNLDDYGQLAFLSAAVQKLRNEARPLLRQLRGRKVWMINSTAQGGGVAEMLPKVVSLLRDLGVITDWAVIKTDNADFFRFTKRMHNLIHGEGDPKITSEEQAIYDKTSRQLADELSPKINPTDILVVHDPQPLGVGSLIKERIKNPMIWRCHIGLDRDVVQTRAVWSFLRPYVMPYDQVVFSAHEYIPDYLTHRSSIIHPAIDPLSDKNRELSLHRVVEVLCNASIAAPFQPVLDRKFAAPARRLLPDGTFGSPVEGGDFGLLYRPIITQISRWDRLKGFAPLLEAFVRLKTRLHEGQYDRDPMHRKRLGITRLVLAGPDTESVQDDPEALDVLKELCSQYASLDKEMQQDVMLLTLPMLSRRENALMVNALQRCSTIVVQNSIQEGFGLTVTEAMWKRISVLGSNACGIRQQIQEGVDGKTLSSPDDPDDVAKALDEMLQDPDTRHLWGRNAQRRVHEMFLVFQQVASWLRVLASVSAGQMTGRVKNK
ncbi:MAG: glycosyltransferase, partial [Betaproteobacteria bacterium]|nr:glycosyltransferase [Betaproteobacteria bacterium]